MEGIKEDTIFTLLSHLMDESEQENSIIESLNNFQISVDEKLIPAIEKVQYENKYELVDRIHDLCRDISLYLYFPEMISQTIVGIVEPNNSACRHIYKQFLRGTFGEENNSCFLSNMVPTIIYKESENQMIHALNLAEKVILLSDKEYLNLLKYSELEEIDLAGLVYGISVPSQNVKTKQVYITIPKGVDIHKKYYVPVKNSIDILVVRGVECNENLLKQYKNVSAILVYGAFYGRNEPKIKKYCKEKDIRIECFNSLSEIMNELEESKYMFDTGNFCHVYYLENILYEISWYLAIRKSELLSPLVDINDNILFKDEISYSYIKQLQKEYNDKLQYVLALYTNYKKICTILIEQIENMQNAYGIKENINYVNHHIRMEEVFLDLILKMSETYKNFPEASGKEKLRRYCNIYNQLSGKGQISEVILNDFLGDDLSVAALKSFAFLQTDSVFYNRKKIDLGDKLSFRVGDYADIIFKLKVPLKNMEKRILGEYYLSLEKAELAKEYLQAAMQKGDRRAGEIMVNECQLTPLELEQAADYGVKIAAYKVAKDLYSKGDYHINSIEMEKCLKYLHIAASQKHLGAIKLLGDICYEKNGKEALHYYLIAEENGSVDSKIKERIGELYYKQQNFKKAIDSFEKCKTPGGNFFLGMIYANGKGCAVNKDKALKYYKKAADTGHMEAQLAYDRLNEEIEESKKKNVVKDNKSYSSSSYTSNYSSSGW